MLGGSEMFLCRALKEFWSDQRGVTLVLVTVGMVGLIGLASLVADFGLLALNKQRLVNAADAAALAGVQELVGVQAGDMVAKAMAQTSAADCAQQNEVEFSELCLDVDDFRVEVNVERQVELLMSKIFGINSGVVKARAVAQTGGISSYTGISPLFVEDQTFNFGSFYILKYDRPQDPGNFGALALGGNGASVFRANLKYGYDGEIKVGDILTTEPGNMAGPTDQGIEYRISQCTHGCTFDHFKSDCPRIMVIPVCEEDSLNGRDEVTVVGFAAFFIESYDDKGVINGRFVKLVTEGNIGSEGSGYGVFGVKLTS